MGQGRREGLPEHCGSGQGVEGNGDESRTLRREQKKKKQEMHRQSMFKRGSHCSPERS
jgi:hypothetical protein